MIRTRFEMCNQHRSETGSSLTSVAAVESFSSETQRAHVAHLCLFVGIDEREGKLDLPAANFLFYPDDHVSENQSAFDRDPTNAFPLLLFSFPSAKDPDWERRHPGKATAEVFTYIDNYDLFSAWEGEEWSKRGEDYQKMKDEIAERMLGVLLEYHPELRGRIDYYELSTPLSTEWFSAYQRGELYGLDHTPERLQQDWLTPRTRIPGLWLTGQDVLTCGVTGAMMAGMLTVVAMVGGRKIGPLMKQIYA